MGVARAAKILTADDGFLSLEHADTRSSQPSHIKGDTVLLAEPDNVYLSGLNGPNVLAVTGNADITAGQIVALRKSSGDIGFAKVKNADGYGIELSELRPSNFDLAPGDTEILAVTTISNEQQSAADGEWRLPHQTSRTLFGVGSTSEGVLGQLVSNVTPTPSGEYEDLSTDGNDFTYDLITGVYGHDIHLLDTQRPVTLSIGELSNNLSRLNFDGGPGQIKSG